VGSAGNSKSPHPPAPTPSHPSRAGLSSSTPSPANRDVVEPLSEKRFKLQVTLDSSVVDKLERCQALSSYRPGGGSVASVLAAALDLLCDRLETQRFGKLRRQRPLEERTSAKPRASAPSGAADLGPAPAASSRPTPTPDAAAAPQSSDKRSRHIPNAVKREVAARDGERCSYVSPSGRRCEEVRYLEYHHEVAFAKGGSHEASNISLLCRAHNALLAEREFGPWRPHVQAPSR